MKKLIIVCEEKFRIYGDYLAQLVSLDDDIEDTIVGIKDGEVAVQVWLEKEYKANSAQLSSNQYLLFIGNGKMVKEKGSYMNVEFSKYGMKYGWLGRQAVLCVDDTMSLDKYGEFYDYAKYNNPNIERLIESIDDKNQRLLEKSEDVIVEAIVEDKGEADAKVPFSSKKLLPQVKEGAKLVVDNTHNVIAKAPVYGKNMVKMIGINKKIKGQQYSCLLLHFYLEDLGKFLGL